MCPCSQMVKTSPFHGEDTSSILVRDVRKPNSYTTMRSMMHFMTNAVERSRYIAKTIPVSQTKNKMCGWSPKTYFN